MSSLFFHKKPIKPGRLFVDEKIKKFHQKTIHRALNTSFVSCVAEGKKIADIPRFPLWVVA